MNVEAPTWSTCIRRVRRRLWRNEFLRRLSLGTAASAVLLLVILAAGAWFGLPAAAVFLAPVPLAAAAVHALRARVSETEAAIFIDRRSGPGDTFASAIAVTAGPFREALRAEAGSRCRRLEVRRLAAFRPSLVARSIPVILVLCVAVQVASGGSGDAAGRVGKSDDGSTISTIRARVRAITADLDREPGGVPDLPSRLREALADVEEVRILCREVREDLLADPTLRKALQEGRIRTDDLGPEEARAARDTLEGAADRLPEGGEARSAAADALRALEARSDSRLMAALDDLSESLREEGGELTNEVESEIRRIGVRERIALPPPEWGGAVPDGEPLDVGPMTGEALERAMDREDIPRRYRDTVRRYFERKGE